MLHPGTPSGFFVQTNVSKRRQTWSATAVLLQRKIKWKLKMQKWMLLQSLCADSWVQSMWCSLKCTALSTWSRLTLDWFACSDTRGVHVYCDTDWDSYKTHTHTCVHACAHAHTHTHTHSHPHHQTTTSISGPSASYLPLGHHLGLRAVVKW